MSAQPFTPSESKSWFAAWMPRRQATATAAAAQARSERAAPHAAEMPAHTESRTPEDWTGDCLFDCYND